MVPPSSEITTSILVVFIFNFSNISFLIFPFTMSRSGFIFFLEFSPFSLLYSSNNLSSVSFSEGTSISISNGSSPLSASGLINFINERFNFSNSSLFHSSLRLSTIRVVPQLNPLGSFAICV